jgi:predicted RNA-binding protein associated with RNAse of E/G family
MGLTTLTVRKLDHAGREVTRYPGDVLTHRDGVLVLRTEWTRDPLDLGFVLLEPSDRWAEYFYADRWYNILEIRTGEGLIKGWYCNVTRPPRITADEVAWEDLALDLWVDARREIQVLDEDEFAGLSLPAAESEAALRALRELRTMVAAGDPPFDTAAPDAR